MNLGIIFNLVIFIFNPDNDEVTGQIASLIRVLFGINKYPAGRRGTLFKVTDQGFGRQIEEAYCFMIFCVWIVPFVAIMDST